MEDVILVNEFDDAIGVLEKLEAHRQGVLHRAFSILLFNSKGEMLLQKRSKNKYHSAGLWTNACCSHPRPGEEISESVFRKLHQEMGISLRTQFAYKFTYKTILENNLIEHELDHVFTGVFDGIPKPNALEVQDWKFMDLVSLHQDISRNPTDYTYWFKLIVSQAKLPELVS